jgi:hypothetical protein
MLPGHVVLAGVEPCHGLGWKRPEEGGDPRRCGGLLERLGLGSARRDAAVAAEEQAEPDKRVSETSPERSRR